MTTWMRRVVSVSPLLCAVVLSGAAQYAMAQEGTEKGPPKVLVIDREYLKPGKSGMAHDKSEASFVRAMSAANSNMHYIALNSMTGPSRSLYLMGFPSFAAWERENQATEKNATLTSALDRAAEADGDLLSSYDRSAWVRLDELTINPGPLKGYRYMEFFSLVVRPGKVREWRELAKMYTDAYRKAVPEAHSAIYERLYGAAPTSGGPQGTTFLIVIPRKSMAEVDGKDEEDKKVMEALGADGMKRAEELIAVTTEAEQTNLYQISPKTSYPRDSWVKDDPDFWKSAPLATTGTKKNISSNAP